MEASEATSPVRLTIAARSGSIVVRNGFGAGVEAPDARVSTEADGSFRVESRSGSIEVTCPPGSDVILGTSSGKVKFEGSFGDVRITSSSGSVEVGAVRSLDIRNRSGSVTIESCTGDLHVVGASGRLEVGRAGVVDVAGVSGSVHLDSVRGGHVRTTSGTVKIGLVAAGDLEVRAVSSSISIEVAPGIAPELRLKSMSGRVTRDVEQGHDCVIAAHTVSGSISVR